MRVLVACYPDEALLRAVGIQRKQVLHFGGKGEVVKKLKDLLGNANRLKDTPHYEKRTGFSRFLADLMDRDAGLQLLRRWVISQSTRADCSESNTDSLI